MKDETRIWLEYAKENLKSSKVLLESKLYNPCLHNVQQRVEKVKYEILSDDGSFYGEIPVCRGVYANAKSRARCILYLFFLTPFSYLDSYILVGTVNSISSSFMSNSTFQSFRIRLTAARLSDGQGR